MNLMIQNDIYSYSVYISLPMQLCLIACFVKILKTFTFVPVHILVPVNISYLFSLNIIPVLGAVFHWFLYLQLNVSIKLQNGYFYSHTTAKTYFGLNVYFTQTCTQLIFLHHLE